MPDKNLTCADCKGAFVFSEREQEHYKSLVEQGKFDRYNEPKRCRPCREVQKHRRRSQGS